MRPYKRLPLPLPSKFDPSEKDPKFFYNNFIKFFIPDMIRMMSAGLCIDDKAVEELRVNIHEILKSVKLRLQNNKIIEQYQNYQQPKIQKNYAENAIKSIRTSKFYVKEFNSNDILHRTWVINTYLQHKNKNNDVSEKWTLNNLKQYNLKFNDTFIDALCKKRRLVTNSHVMNGMSKLAEYKAFIWNKPRYEKSQHIVETPEFNPGSSKQKQELFKMLKIPPLAVSKDTGEASWGREQLEQLKLQSSNTELLEALEALIDYSYSAIIKNNFLKAFDSYTIDGVLHGNIRLFGAKSCRCISNQPNLFNMPSTGSIYAKSVKRCFKAFTGHVIYTADLSALEDRVIANLSGDKNKLNTFLDGLDGHSLAAVFYKPKEAEIIIGKFTDKIEASKKLQILVNEGNIEAEQFRQDSKGISFKLAYGGFPDFDKGGAITQEIFDNYHNVLYPGITKYREKYVLPTVRKNGYIHLGLGCRIYSSNATADIRTLNNSTVQFWSILTLIAINEFNYRIDEKNLNDEVQVISTIYDSIYIQVIKNPEIIAWVNNNLIELLCVEYIKNEIIHNEANAEIGLNWADLYKLKNNATTEEIHLILKKL